MNNKIRSNATYIFCLFGLVAMTLPARAAIFDCEKAATKVEKLICGDAELSKLDDELNTSYEYALQGAKQAYKIKQAQRQWVRERNGCEDTACIKRAYEKRMSSLKPENTNDATPEKHSEGFSYQMIHGKGRVICEELLNRLNGELMRRPNGPVCAFDILKAIPGVVLPEWKKLDLTRNELLHKQYLLANGQNEVMWEYAVDHGRTKPGSGLTFDILATCLPLVKCKA